MEIMVCWCFSGRKINAATKCLPRIGELVILDIENEGPVEGRVVEVEHHISHGQRKVYEATVVLSMRGE